LSEPLPTSKAKREANAEVVGVDGWALLAEVFAHNAPSWLRDVPAVETLRRVWVQQYIYVEGAIQWRNADNTSPSTLMISSPYDTEAHYACKGSTSWVGYKVHSTETCDQERLHLIRHVETTPAPGGDYEAVEPIHEALERKELLPSTHLVDTGYVEAKLLVTIPRQYGVDLYGPPRSDVHWQSKAGRGFDAGSFQIDWDKQEATCPEGKRSLSWSPAVPRQIIYQSSSQFLLKSSLRLSGGSPQSLVFGEYYANPIVYSGFGKNSANDFRLLSFPKFCRITFWRLGQKYLRIVTSVKIVKMYSHRLDHRVSGAGHHVGVVEVSGCGATTSVCHGRPRTGSPSWRSGSARWLTSGSGSRS
jgi:hypothetical protein